MNTTTIKVMKAAAEANVPVLLWGAPGIGKSSLVETVARDMDVSCEVVIGSIREPSDFAGLPVVSSNNDVVMAPPAWAKRLAAAGKGLAFLDEISTASPATQAAMLRVVLDRTVGDLTLPKGVAVIAAANPPECSAGGWDLSAPLANRFLHLDSAASAETFRTGMTLGWDATIPATDASITVSDSDLAAARALVAGFINVKPTLLHVLPADEASAGRAWPSPRTWDMLAAILPRLGGDTAAEKVAAVGLVGEGAAVEFLTWKAQADLPHPESVLASPSSVDWSMRPDKVFAVLSGVVAVVATNTTKTRWTQAWDVVAAAASGAAPDAAGAAAVKLAAITPDGAEIPASATALMPIVRRAGLLASNPNPEAAATPRRTRRAA